jgi:hypothetical protein
LARDLIFHRHFSDNSGGKQMPLWHLCSIRSMATRD